LVKLEEGKKVRAVSALAEREDEEELNGNDNGVVPAGKDLK